MRQRFDRNIISCDLYYPLWNALTSCITAIYLTFYCRYLTRVACCLPCFSVYRCVFKQLTPHIKLQQNYWTRSKKTMFKTHFSVLLVLSLSAFTRSKDINNIQEFVKVNLMCKQSEILWAPQVRLSELVWHLSHFFLKPSLKKRWHLSS